MRQNFVSASSRMWVIFLSFIQVARLATDTLPIQLELDLRARQSELEQDNKELGAAIDLQTTPSCGQGKSQRAATRPPKFVYSLLTQLSFLKLNLREQASRASRLVNKGKQSPIQQGSFTKGAPKTTTIYRRKGIQPRGLGEWSLSK